MNYSADASLLPSSPQEIMGTIRHLALLIFFLPHIFGESSASRSAEKDRRPQPLVFGDK